ncbi:carboxypeptidase-like regulatory domain-containing protein [Flavobacterium sp. J49]|uniref:carboxypeptidase-like regulatory domain-containing protein n=1 Tax=Flavobacterium sp. J49 TaxID=2718534 RepID=UPI0015949A7F|nr:carboxypeptidase-like regulatory domain-containing protein [Flavobacterium sp. J49]MBF6641455.1 carboxypeptidase-like regulatory domain-containing protein [Flavobacterium sp. J49]NIC02702.1 carboxypeptidase-like regulatory domain-containing protein [Flavobacterium sp. J49]
MKFFFALFSFLSLSAQTKGIVVDENNKPIPYVNIWVENENIGTTSDENGAFIMNISEDKTLVFSSVGFEVKKTTVKDGEKVILVTAIYNLREVVISKRKQDKEIEIGDAQRIHHRQLSGDKPWIYGKLFEQDTIYKKTPFLKKIVFYSDSDKKGAKLKIRIFEFNDSIPGNDLINEDLIVKVNKGMKRNVIDVSKYNLLFPEKGIVIGLEWMIIEENRADFEYKDSKTKKLVKLEDYAPSLVVNYSDKENAFTYSRGKWIRSKIFLIEKKSKEPWSNKVMMPAINLILSN